MIWHLLSYDLLKSHCLTDWPNDVAPRRVLDIGCGEGSWVTDLARTPGWEQTELIGLDVVPCQTPLHDHKLAQRVSWVVANAFDGLSMFPDGSFDFVHMRFMVSEPMLRADMMLTRSAQGGNSVPEDKLTDLIDTMVRLTAPGGRIEILEADTIFLGTPHLIPASDMCVVQHAPHTLLGIADRTHLQQSARQWPGVHHAAHRPAGSAQPQPRL